jgi:hypothetical protein
VYAEEKETSTSEGKETHNCMENRPTKAKAYFSPTICFDTRSLLLLY